MILPETCLKFTCNGLKIKELICQKLNRSFWKINCQLSFWRKILKKDIQSLSHRRNLWLVYNKWQKKFQQLPTSWNLETKENKLPNMKSHHFGWFMLPEQMGTIIKCMHTSLGWRIISILETLVMMRWWNARDLNLVKKLLKEKPTWRCVTTESELIFSKITRLTFSLEKLIIANSGKSASLEDSCFHLVVIHQVHKLGELIFYKTMFLEVILTKLTVL